MIADIGAFFADRSVNRIETFVSDLNGILRGKWIPGKSWDKLDGGVRLPLSTSALDIWGHDIEGSGLGIVSGDKDGLCLPVAETLVPVPWASQPTAQCLMMLARPDGGPSPYDPRHVLQEVLSHYTAAGLTPVVATELEFFLYQPTDAPGDPIAPPPACRQSHLYDYAPMADCAAVLDAIEAACAVQGIPSDTITAESGLGQFEINFHHCRDALRAADIAVLFRRLVRGVAAQHGLAATFLAKPYGEDAGSGMHAHVSIEDADGRNIFAGDGALSQTLRHALGGVLETLPAFQAIFAPNLNSYRRFETRGFAPTSANWGYDHRAAALRIPEVAGKAARFEHRVAGADANPYLVLAAILAGALHGMTTKRDPGPPIEEGGAEGLGALSLDWGSATARFAASDLAPQLLGPELCRVYAGLKRFEADAFLRKVTDVERETYLGRI